MTLAAWQRLHGIDDAAFADLLGGCSARTVRAWKAGEIVPPAPMITRIERVTRKQVTLRDWLVCAPTARAS